MVADTHESSLPEPRIRKIFAEALQITSAEERTRYLNRSCEGQSGLRAQVDSLLRAHERTHDWLIESEEDHSLASGQWIGRYRLVSKLGEGGFSTVFLAEQEEPVQRQVALKLLKRGMDTQEIVARFRAERQALAVMHHPNIARVFDGGEAPNGLPYFVMELAPGISITEYCRSKELSLTNRLELFIQLCGAVEHAHLKGIIHRDLKPSNILVTQQDGQAVPKVIDFGIAKSLDVQLTDSPAKTRTRMVMGTPSHMSPEQASGAEVTKASDLFSLGSVLYELLTDTQLRKTDKPFPVAESIRQLQVVDPRKLNKKLDADLATICLKCLEDDPGCRYRSARALAEDLDRWLHGESIVARPRRRSERLWRWTRRYPTAAGLIVSLACGAIVTSLLWWETARQGEAKRFYAAILVGVVHRNIHDLDEAGTSKIRVAAEVMLGFSPNAVYDPEASRITLSLVGPGSRARKWRRYVPLILHLQDRLAETLGGSILIDLDLIRDEHFASSYLKNEDSYISEVPLGVLAQLGPDLGGLDRPPYRLLVRKENRIGYTGIVIAGQDSGFSSLSEIGNSTLRFGDLGSPLTWNGLAQIQAAGFTTSSFRECGFHADGVAIRAGQVIALSQPRETGPNSRTLGVAGLVANGEIDVGVTYDQYLDNNPLVVLHRFPVIHPPWVAKGVSQEVADAFVKAMSEMNPNAFRGALGQDCGRFVRAAPADYSPLNEVLLVDREFPRAALAALGGNPTPTNANQSADSKRRIAVLEALYDED